MHMRLALKESLFLGFCAVFILLTRVALGFPVHIPGHLMFFAMLFLMVARGSVDYCFAATYIAVLAGVGGIVLGIEGPLLLPGLLAPGLAVDIGALVFPVMFQSYLLCSLIGALASSTAALTTCVIDLLLGMDRTIIIQHVVLHAAGSVLFGTAGSIFVPQIIKRLKSFGVIQTLRQER